MTADMTTKWKKIGDWDETQIAKRAAANLREFGYTSLTDAYVIEGVRKILAGEEIKDTVIALFLSDMLKQNDLIEEMPDGK